MNKTLYATRHLIGACILAGSMLAANASAALLDGLDVKPGQPGGNPPKQAVPENTSWKVTIQWCKTDSAQASQSASTAAQKTAMENNAYAKGVQRMEIRNYEGQQWVHIIMGNDVVYFRPETGTILPQSSTQLAEDGLSYQAGSLPELVGIGSAKYLGTTTYRGVVCDAYRNSGGKNLTILLNRTTRLPVAVETAEEIRHYEWGKLDQPIVVPAEVQAALKKNADAAASRKRRYSIPQ